LYKSKLEKRQKIENSVLQEKELQIKNLKDEL